MLDGVLERGCGFYVLEAPSGMGKSSLLEAALDRRNFRLVRARSAGGQEAHRTARLLIRGVLGYAPDFEGEIGVGSAAVARAWSDRLHRYADLADAVLRELSGAPAVLMLDDLQWVDEASAAFLQVLVDELLGAHAFCPLLVAVATRNTVVDHPGSLLIKTMRTLPASVSVTLGPLEGSALVEAIEHAGFRGPSATFQAVVQDASGGNPLRVRAALELLRRRDVPPDLRPNDRRAQGRLDIPIPSDDPVGDWVDGLDTASQRALGAAALFGREFSLSDAARVSAGGVLDVATAVDQGHELGLLESDGVLHWFTHDLVREELGRRVLPSQRPAVHRRGAALERGRAIHDPSAWARAAEHELLASGDDVTSEPTETFEHAARWALESGAWAAAARYAEAAADAARLWCPDAASLVRLDLLAAEASHFNHDLDNTQRRVRLVLGGPGIDDVSTGMALGLGARTAMMASAQAGTGRLDLGPLRRFIDQTTNEQQRGRALQQLAECELGEGYLEDAMAHAEEAVRCAERVGDRRDLNMGYMAVGFAHLTAINHEHAEAAYSRAHELAVERADGYLQSESMARLMFIPLVAGDLGEAERRAVAAVEAGNRYRQYVSEALGESVLALIAALREDLVAVEGHARRARTTMLRSGYFLTLQFLYPALIRGRLLAGDHVGAEQALRDWSADGGRTAPPPRRYARVIAAAAGRPEPAGSVWRPPGRLTQFTVGFTAIDVELAVAHRETSSVGRMIEHLEAGHAAGAQFAMNWPVSIARVVGDARRLLGDADGAAVAYRDAIHTSARQLARSEELRAQMGLATLPDGTADDDERRAAAAGAHRLALLLGRGSDAAAAALALRGSIETTGPDAELDPDFRVVLVTDIVGSTALSVERGDRAYHETVMSHHDVVRHALTNHGGHEFSEGGDSLLAWFGDCASAVACAVAVQSELAALRAGRAGFRVRIGIAAGVPLIAAGRPYGGLVNLAARIVSEAAPDEVVATDAVRRAVPEAFALKGPATLRGFPGEVDIYRLRLTDVSAIAPPASNLLGHR
jgi:class 3 adenylate cyclase